MKRLILILSAVLTLSSCAPEKYSLLYKMRYPGEAGFVLGNKTMSIVYLDNGVKNDSLYVSDLAQGFAKGLEKVYFGGEEAIPVFCLAKDAAGRYASKDTLVNLLMDTGSDVMFLFDSQSLYVYDSMNPQRDSVVAVVMDHSIDAADYGVKVSSLFTDKESLEAYSVYYYENSDTWVNALFYADQGEWVKAMDIWMKILANTDNIEKQSCAAYNLATACYMLEDYDLATEWLDASDGYYKLTNDDSLRRRILKMQNKL